MKIILNEKLRELRRKKDITQEELANRFGISPQAVSILNMQKRATSNERIFFIQQPPK